MAALLACAGAGLLLVRTLVARTHLQRLAAALESGNAPQDSLRRTLGDESLTLGFAVGTDEWADAAGRPSAGPSAGQVTTQVFVGADLVARVHHAPDSGRADALAASLTPELRLAIEHARLTARLEAQVRLLQASRARVVEAADETRRGLERDLHDGAQQELLALGFDVRRAHNAAPQDECLARCMEEVTRCARRPALARQRGPPSAADAQPVWALPSSSSAAAARTTCGRPRCRSSGSLQPWNGRRTSSSSTWPPAARSRSPARWPTGRCARTWRARRCLAVRSCPSGWRPWAGHWSRRRLGRR